MEVGESFVAFRIPSELRYVAGVVDACGRLFKEYGVREGSGASVVLRELLNNAVRHGNQCVSDRVASARIERLPGRRFKIVVEDEGDGFDYRSLETALPEDPRRVRNRGYVLVHALADQVEFNDRGNRVTAYVSAS